MPYAVDDEDFWASLAGRQLDDWVIPLAEKKISTIKGLDDPRSIGGVYRGKWGYPIGKLHVVALIDDKNQTVRLIELIKFP
ncbi:MAG: hypothetical protein LBH94_05600 [Deltaproteobacteria bacterium]|jgi:hypothetical protein|nr:hypothetical protein [Deltaproteobacteria bacterium]